MVQEGSAGGDVRNVRVDAFDNVPVVFELTNKYFFSPKTPLVYQGVLKKLRARCELSEAEVRDVIFKPQGQLNARVNENLLEFTVRINFLDMTAESSNRVLIYRRKAFVFVPGLLGSTISVKTSKGLVSIYPNIYPTVSDEQERVQLERFFRDLVTYEITPLGPSIKIKRSTEGASKLINYFVDVAKHKNISLLECDAEGKPLLETEPELFRLLGALPGTFINKYLSKGVVYDVQDVLRGQWEERDEFCNRPRDHQPFEIVPWPYDWRLNLEDSAKAVRFQSTGTRLMLSRVVDSMNLSPEQKPQTERALRQILDDYDATMRRNSFPNDLALALSAFLGMSSAVYHEHQIPPGERLIELRNIIAESAFKDRIFQHADDRKKQELYETVIMYGTLAYAGYENAKQKGSREEIDKYRQFAGENIKTVFRLSPEQLIFTQSGLKFLTPLK